MAESETHGVCMSKWPGMRRSARTRIAGYARAESDDAMNEHKDLVGGVWRGCLLATKIVKKAAVVRTHCRDHGAARVPVYILLGSVGGEQRCRMREWKRERVELRQAAVV